MSHLKSEIEIQITTIINALYIQYMINALYIQHVHVVLYLKNSNSLLQLLFWPELATVPTLLLPTILGSWMQSSIAPTDNKVCINSSNSHEVVREDTQFISYKDQ